MSGLRRLGGRALAALVPGLPYAWLALFFLVPFGITLKISLSDPVLAQPPYLPLLDWEAGFTGWREFLEALDFANYALLLEDDLYWRAALASVRLAATATALLALIGLPFALALARAPRRWQPVLVALVVVPFWTSFLIRVYAWTAILRPDGLLDRALGWIGLPPAGLLNSESAVMLGLVYTYLPFMVLPLYAVLERMDATLVEAARDLGAGPVTAFLTVTLPLIAPAVAAGFLLAFTLSLDDLVVASFVAGPGATTLPMRLYGQIRLGVTPEINAASTLMIAGVTVIVLAASLLAKRRAA